MVLVYSPKYALKNEIWAVAICDSGYPEERTFPHPNVFFTSREEGASPVSGRGREPVSGKLGGFSWTFTQERRTGEGCGPFREKQACRFSVNILFVCLFVCRQKEPKLDSQWLVCLAQSSIKPRGHCGSTPRALLLIWVRRAPPRGPKRKAWEEWPPVKGDVRGLTNTFVCLFVC